MYEGWIIIGSEGSKEELEQFGVILGEFNGMHGSYACRCDQGALDTLDGFWGTYIWALHSVEEERA